VTFGSRQAKVMPVFNRRTVMAKAKIKKTIKSAAKKVASKAVKKAKPAKDKAKKAAKSSAQSAYKYVTQLAEDVISDVQKRVAGVLHTEGSKGGDLAKLRKEWLGKRISRTNIGKAITKKKS
jgi:hypothetical protein